MCQFSCLILKQTFTFNKLNVAKKKINKLFELAINAWWMCTFIKRDGYYYYTEGNPFMVPIYLMIAPIWIWPRAETTPIKHNLKLYSGKPKDSIVYLLTFINRQLWSKYSSLAVLKSFGICRQKIWFLSSGDNQIWWKEKRKWWPLGIMGISHLVYLFLMRRKMKKWYG